MTLAVIGLGSNVGHGRKNLRSAWAQLLRVAGTEVVLSSPFLTEPVGMESSALFTNAVGILETQLAPRDLLARMLEIECRMGRDRRLGKDRGIDLDLLYYGDLIMREGGLWLPHPRLAERGFVLIPLAEIAPQWRDPLSTLTVAAMLDRLHDAGGVTKITWEAS